MLLYFLMIIYVRSNLWSYHYVTIDHWPLVKTLDSKILKFIWNLGWVVLGLDEKSSCYLVLTGGGGVGTQDVEDFPLSEHRFLHLTTDPPPAEINIMQFYVVVGIFL